MMKFCRTCSVPMVGVMSFSKTKEKNIIGVQNVIVNQKDDLFLIVS